MPKHFFVFQELYTQDKFDRNVIPQQILKQKTLVRTKKRPFCTQKLFRKSLSLLTVSAVPKDFSTDTERQHCGKIQRHFARSGEGQNEIQRQFTCMSEW